MTARAFDGRWHIQFFRIGSLHHDRALDVDRLITEAPYTSPFTQLGRIYLTINNLNLVNSYMDWDSREPYFLRIMPLPDSQSWVDMIDARIVSYGTMMREEDGHNRMVYDMSWTYRVSSVHAFNFMANEKAALLESAALRWQEVGF